MDINFLQSSDGYACMTWLDFGSFWPVLVACQASSRGNLVRTCKHDCFVLVYCNLQRLAARVNTQLLHGIMSSRHHVIIIIILVISMILFLAYGFGLLLRGAVLQGRRVRVIPCLLFRRFSLGLQLFVCCRAVFSRPLVSESRLILFAL
jgi:hypothetical protein